MGDGIVFALNAYKLGQAEAEADVGVDVFFKIGRHTMRNVRSLNFCSGKMEKSGSLD